MTPSPLQKTLLALALAAPLSGFAESNVTFAPGGNVPTPIEAEARLDFRVVIPRVLLLQVGSLNGTVDLVEFDLGTTEPGSGTPVGRTNGAEIPVRVLGNNGQVSLLVENTGDLSDGAGNSIPWTQIAVTSTTVTGGGVPHPAPNFDGSTLVPVAGSITNSTANWGFEFANTAVLAAGSYGGVNTNNGRVTYTASMP